MTAPPLALQALLAGVALVAALYDFRFRRVPNWLVLAGLILGIALNTWLAHWTGLWRSLEGAGLALAIYLPLFLIRGMGGGDVKLMAAVGAMVGPANWLVIFVVTALLGGALALVLVVVKGRLAQTLANVAHILRSLASARAPHTGRPELDVESEAGFRLPHAVVIALGSLAYLAVIGPRAW